MKQCLVGPRELANNVRRYSEALVATGKYQCTTFVTVRQSYYESNCYSKERITPPKCKNILLRQLWRFSHSVSKSWFFLRSLANFSHYIYVTGDTYLPLYLDFIFLKLFRKKVVVVHTGSEIRYRDLHNRLFEAIWGVVDPDKLVNKKVPSKFISALFNQRIPELFGVPIVSLRNCATFQCKPFNFLLYYIEIPKGLEVKKATDRPKIVHAPTHRIIKGTAVVLDVIERLEKEGYSFDFELIEKQPNDYVRQQLRSTDILVDSLETMFGALIIEGMAARCATVSGVSADVEGVDINFPCLPFQDFDSLYNSLKALLEDKKLRQQKMDANFEHFLKYYSMSSFQKYIEDCFANKGIQVPPIKDHKRLLLKYANNWWQVFLIYIFIW